MNQTTALLRFNRHQRLFLHEAIGPCPPYNNAAIRRWVKRADYAIREVQRRLNFMKKGGAHRAAAVQRGN